MMDELLLPQSWSVAQDRRLLGLTAARTSDKGLDGVKIPNTNMWK